MYIEQVEVYDWLTFQNKAEKMDIDAILLKLEEFCVWETNKTYERYRFNKCNQVS